MPNFKGDFKVDRALVSEQIEANVHAFLNWSMLSAGGFADASGQASVLRRSDDPAHSGRAWEGRRKQWVWESGVGHDRQPVAISGVWADGVFRPRSGVGPYAHVVDYENGRVLFDSPVDASGVRCDHSYRLAQIYRSDSPWALRVQADAGAGDPGFFTEGSGSWSVPPQLRAQPPAVVVEVVPSVTRTPYEIGSLRQYVRQDVHLHVLSTPRSRNAALWLHDALVAQQEHMITAFDKNKAADSGALPLGPTGLLSPAAVPYPELSREGGDWFWGGLRVARTSSVGSPPAGGVSHAVVRWSCEVVDP